MIPAMAIGFPVTRSGFFLICESETEPRMIAATAGIGPKHIQPTVTLIIPNIIEATLRPLLGGTVYAGGGGGCQTGLTGCGSKICPPPNPLPDGRFQVACSFGFEASVGVDALIVGGVSLDSGAESIRVVPS